MSSNCFFPEQIVYQVIIAAPSANSADDRQDNHIAEDLKRYKCIVSTITETVTGSWFENEFPTLEKKLNKYITELEGCAELDFDWQQQL